jgi:hypothetical protein
VPIDAIIITPNTSGSVSGWNLDVEVLGLRMYFSGPGWRRIIRFYLQASFKPWTDASRVFNAYIKIVIDPNWVRVNDEGDRQRKE